MNDVRFDSFICVTWLIRMCDMTHSYVWHDSFTCVTWLIHMCDMTHSYVRHDTLICVTWHTHMCDMTHSYVWHDSFICVTWLICVTCDVAFVMHLTKPCMHCIYGVISHICLSHVTRLFESCHTSVWVMSHISLRHASVWVMSHIWLSHAIIEI